MQNYPACKVKIIDMFQHYNNRQILVHEGREELSNTISGQSSALCWRVNDCLTLNAGLVAIFQGIRACIARKPYIFAIFQGGSGPNGPPPPHGSAHVFSLPFWVYKENKA